MNFLNVKRNINADEGIILICFELHSGFNPTQQDVKSKYYVSVQYIQYFDRKQNIFALK